MEQPVKFDSKHRTTIQGFRYANSDPANRHDRTPTDFSYIDFVFQSQLEVLDEKLSVDSDEHMELRRKRRDLVHSMEQRRARVARLPSFVVVRDDEHGHPAGGQVLAAMTLLVVLAGFVLTIADTNLQAAVSMMAIGMVAWFSWVVGANYDLDPYGSFEVAGDE